MRSRFTVWKHLWENSDIAPFTLTARLHESPRLINAVESTKFNSTVERYCLHSSTKVSVAVDFKMAANELVREGVVICDCLMKECQHSLEKRNKRENTTFYSFCTGEQIVTCLLIRVICGESPRVNQRRWTKVGHHQLVHPSAPFITFVERNCLHGSLWLIQPRWSTWGTRVNAS